MRAKAKAAEEANGAEELGDQCASENMTTSQSKPFPAPDCSETKRELGRVLQGVAIVLWSLGRGRTGSINQGCPNDLKPVTA